MIPYGRQSIDDDDIRAVVEVLKSDWLTSGPKTSEFEDALCRYVGCKHAVVVNSGTSALDIAIQALDLPLGSEVITSPLTFAATANALLYNRVKPVFADIERATRNIDPDSIRQKITDKTRAIAYVDYAGHPCDITALKEIANEHDLFLIEDACHAIGAEYNGKKIGNFADLTIFSFHPVKHITTGEGGAVLDNNSELYQNLCLYRNHGIDRDARARYGSDASWAYDMKRLGRNYRMTDIQAALGISQLKKLELFIAKRIRLAVRYNDLLNEIKLITLPETKGNVRHAWHLYTILLDPHINRDDFFRYMREKGIGVNVHYIPVYRHSYYQERVGCRGMFLPVTEDVFSHIITLPLYPDLSQEQQDYIVHVIETYASHSDPN
jgi:UDP-4-amino-4,6-dideoxy-N-acetyl-beta-L-altrosamine transaminase